MKKQTSLSKPIHWGKNVCNTTYTWRSFISKSALGSIGFLLIPGAAVSNSPFNHGNKSKEEISANLERAEKSIAAAKKLLSDEYYDFAASRAYYSVFYAATAVLLKHNLEFRKHSGVIASIH